MDEQQRILVVDDDAKIRKVLRSILVKEGYAVDTAKTASEAIKKSHESFYNLALIDIRLPDMSGTRLLTKIKDTIPKMAKVILTGYPSMQNAIEALNKGADSYIQKPFNVENVLQVIEEQLRRQSEARKYSQEKVTEFIETRARELHC